MLVVYSECWNDMVSSKRQLNIVSSCPVPQQKTGESVRKANAMLQLQASAEPQNTPKQQLANIQW